MGKKEGGITNPGFMHMEHEVLKLPPPHPTPLTNLLPPYQGQVRIQELKGGGGGGKMK